MPEWALASFRIAAYFGADGLLAVELVVVAVFGVDVGLAAAVVASLSDVESVGSCANNETPLVSKATDKVHNRCQRVFMVAIPWGVRVFGRVEEEEITPCRRVIFQSR